MAAAEARAIWQRAANRYFVQEDAKRAPRLARCPSSTLLSKQSGTGPTNAGNDPNHPAIGLMPSTTTSSYSNLPQDAKWWLQTEPSYRVHHRHLNPELSKSTTSTETSAPAMSLSIDSSFTEIAAMSEESVIREVDYENLESFLDVKKSKGSKVEEEEEVMSVVNDNKIDQDFLDVKNMTDYYELLEMEMNMDGGYDGSKTSELSFDSGSSIGGEKLPWWHVTDGEELASFVAQKSLHHIENCDLPPPQKMCVSRETSSYGMSFAGSLRKHWSSLDEGPSLHIEHPASAPLSAPENGTTPTGDPSRAKLLEALCHSQTRAREAEKAAKEAYSEKEHLLKLFFRQASHLFAYKQWFKMLQLEALLLQRKEANPGLPGLFPCLMSKKPRKLHKRLEKFAKSRQRKRSLEESEMGKYCIAFALGFTLVGTGLVLGWTVGWLFPTV